MVSSWFRAARSSLRLAAMSSSLFGGTAAWAIVLALATVAQATTPDGPRPYEEERIYGSLNMYIRLSEDVSPESRATTRFRLPFLQTVHVGSHHTGVAGLSVEALGYGEIEAIEPFTGSRGRGDLLLGTVTWRGLENGALTLRAGRQLLWVPAANNGILDGLFVGLRLPLGFQVQAWGGFTAEPDFDQSAENYQTGGRLAWVWRDYGSVGVAFSHEAQFGEVAREVLGADWSWRQFRWLQAAGLVLVDTVEMSLQELHAYVETTPGADVRVHAEYRRFDPDARIPKTSIFSVFNDRTFDEAGASVGWFPREGMVSVFADGSVLVYEDDEIGGKVLVRPRVVFRRGWGDMIGLEAGRTWSHDTGYWNVRLFGAYSPLEWLHLTASTEQAILDDDLNGHGWSNVSRLNAGADVGEGFSVLLDGMVTVSPYVNQEWAGLLRLSWDLTRRAPRREVSP